MTPNSRTRPSAPRAHARLGRVDGGDGDQRIGILGGARCHFLVRVAPETGFTFGIDGKDHHRDVPRPIMYGGFGNGRRVLPWRTEMLGNGRLQVVAVISMVAAGLFGMREKVDAAPWRNQPCGTAIESAAITLPFCRSPCFAPTLAVQTFPCAFHFST